MRKIYRAAPYVVGAMIIGLVTTGAASALATSAPSTSQEVAPSASTAVGDSAQPTTASLTTTTQSPSHSTPVPTTVGPTTTSPVVPSQPTEPKYILALWAMDHLPDKFPQTLITYVATDSTDVHALDSKVTACGQYQADLYANDDRTAALIAKGILNGGDESFPKGEPQRYNVFTIKDCEEPTSPPTTTPPSTPPSGEPTPPATTPPVVSPPPTSPPVTTPPVTTPPVTTPPVTTPPVTSPVTVPVTVPPTTVKPPVTQTPAHGTKSGSKLKSEPTSASTPTSGSSLAYTGSTGLNWIIGIGVTLFGIGFIILIVRLARGVWRMK